MRRLAVDSRPKEPRRVNAELIIPEPTAAKALAIRTLFSDTPNHLQLPEDLTFEQYTAFAPQLSRVVRSVQWWIGDFLNYGKRRFDKQFKEVVDTLNLNDGKKYGDKALEQAQWVTSRITPAERDLRLSWSHYVRIATFKSKHERKYWTDRAIKDGLSSRDLGTAIATDRKTKASRTAAGPVHRYDRFDNDRLLMRVTTANDAFYQTFQAAQLQFSENRTFDHTALRPATVTLHDTLGELLKALVAPGKKATPAPVSRGSRGWDKGIAAAS